MGLFTRKRLAKALDLTPQRIAQMDTNNQLPSKVTDDDGEKGWTDGTVYALRAAREQRQVSPALASMPEATEGATVSARALIHYSANHNYRSGELPQGSLPALATQYETPHGPVVIIQSLSEGSTVPGYPTIHCPQESLPLQIETEPELTSATFSAAEALALADPFAVRWVLLTRTPFAFVEDPGQLQEVIIETVQGPSRHYYQRDWPWTASAHEIPQAVVRSRLGIAPEVMPSAARTRTVAEEWEQSGWDPEFVAHVDLDRSASNAVHASTLYALRDDPVSALADLLYQKVKLHSQGDAPSDDDLKYLLTVPEDSARVPQVAYPQTPGVTSPHPDQQSPDQTPTPGQSAIQTSMDAAQRLLDYEYVAGKRPDPVIQKALQVGLQAGTAATSSKHSMRDGYRTHPAYFLRAVRSYTIPGAAQESSPLRFPSDTDTFSLGGKSPEQAENIEIIKQNTSWLHAQDTGALAGCPAIKGTAGVRDKTTMYSVMVPTIWDKEQKPSHWSTWNQLQIHCDTQDGVVWVRREGKSLSIMPMPSNLPMTTGYNGSGPHNAVSVLAGFLAWAHGRDLSEDEMHFLRYRITTSKREGFVTIQRAEMPSLG